MPVSVAASVPRGLAFLPHFSPPDNTCQNVPSTSLNFPWSCSNKRTAFLSVPRVSVSSSSGTKTDDGVAQSLLVDDAKQARRGNISGLYNRFLTPRRITTLINHNTPSVFGSLVDNFSVDDAEASKNAPRNETITSTWKWRGYSIRYQYCGTIGPALVLIHGFGANSDHWRKNLPVLAESHKVYAIDLIGYGYSDKPNPDKLQDENFYTFETWASQLNDFCMEVVKDEVFFVCNSIGGLVGLQAAAMDPLNCKGIILFNISLRMLHIKKQPWYGRPLIKSFQSLLRYTSLGKLFFKTVATPESVRNILCQCYYDTSQVTDELVNIILKPGLDPGAADVFLEFICYSGGPLPEELLPQVKCPVLVAWGDKDPWEPIELGKAYAEFPCVQDFVVLPNVGHCPQDEAPNLVNPLIASFVAQHDVQPEK